MDWIEKIMQLMYAPEDSAGASNGESEPAPVDGKRTQAVNDMLADLDAPSAKDEEVEEEEEIEDAGAPEEEEEEEEEEVEKEEPASSSEEQPSHEEQGEGGEEENETERLLANLNNMAAELSKYQAQQPQEQEEGEEGAERNEAKAPEATLDIAAELGDVDPYSKEGLNKMANILYKKAYNTVYENTLRSISPMVNTLVAERIRGENAARDFFTKNPDLAQHRQYLAFTANKIAAEHPDWTIDKIYDETGNTVRKELGGLIGKNAQEKEKPGRGKGAAPGTNTRKIAKSKKPKSAIEQDFEDFRKADKF